MVKFTFDCFCVVFNVHHEGVPSKLDNAPPPIFFSPSVVAPALVSLDVPQYAIAHSLVAPSYAKNPRRRTAKRSDLDVSFRLLLRKEVTQPHLPIRLPCYDFTPVIAPTLDGCLHNG